VIAANGEALKAVIVRPRFVWGRGGRRRPDRCGRRPERRALGHRLLGAERSGGGRSVDFLGRLWDRRGAASRASAARCAAPAGASALNAPQTDPTLIERRRSFGSPGSSRRSSCCTRRMRP
jgi:hypothetical protein